MATMRKGTVWTGLFRGTATLGIGTILWLQQNYTPREKFEDYRIVINEKLDRLQRGQDDMASEMRRMQRNVRAAMALPESER